VAYPTDDPARATIMGNIVTALQGIAGAPTYRTTVHSSNVKVLGANALQLPSFPALIVEVERQTTTDNVFPMILQRMQFDVLAAVESRTDALKKVRDLIEDVRIALLTDVSRGGLAVDTHVTADEPFVPEVSQPLYAARITVDVQYRHQRLDPSAVL
jgi:hypothetical protein